MIGINHPDIKIIADEYFDRFRVSIDKSWFQKILTKENDRGFKSMVDYYKEMISPNNFDLIRCKPDNLEYLNNVFSNNFEAEINNYISNETNGKSKTSYGIFIKTMTILYNKFINENGYWLIQKLNIKSCPYCNRTYTFSVNDKVKVRPEFDHFYPKSKYPLLALCFYNLIPSCPICNHLKREKIIDLNPYLIDSDNNPIKFKLLNNEGVRNEKDINISISCRNGVGLLNVKELGLRKLYKQHKDYVKEIMDKAVAYNGSYYDGLIESFRGMGLKEQQIDNLIWGVYLENEDLEKRPMSKLTRDILEQFGIK